MKIKKRTKNYLGVNMFEQKNILKEVVKNITREDKISITLSEDKAMINIKVKTFKSIYFYKKLNKILVNALRGAFKYLVIKYIYNKKIIYSFVFNYDFFQENF